MFGTKNNISLVIPFMETDLERVIKEPSMILGAADIKSYAMMTLRGLEYLHKHWILHRVSWEPQIGVEFLYPSIYVLY